MKLAFFSRQGAAMLAIAATILNTAVVQGQPIVPAPNDAGTTVTPSGDRLNITGGQTSREMERIFSTVFKSLGLAKGRLLILFLLLLFATS